MEQPKIQDRKELLDLFKKEEINIAGTNKVLRIGYIKGYTQEKLSGLGIDFQQKMATFDKKAMKFKVRSVAKAVSYSVLNGMKIYFFHWAYWRWLYYIKGYTYNQLEPILELIKKKIPLRAYSKSTMLVWSMDVTMMSMTPEEQKATQQELLSVKEDKSEKSTNG